MAVSANTLFHFTSTDSLRKILLSKEFFVNYSLEHFESILPASSIYERAYVPLISFCDLTITQLSQIPKHTQDFGKYGIGLRKEWGVKNRVSPVIYVHDKSYPSNSIYDLIKLFNSMSKSFPDGNFYSDVRAKLVDFIKFIKPYQGHWQKGKKSSDLIRYYDEREWRYCPDGKKYIVFSAKKDNSKTVNRLRTDLRKDSALKFSPDDIKYIIIDKKEEIQLFFKVIDNMNIAPKKKNELKTRIITFDEIEEDF